MKGSVNIPASRALAIARKYLADVLQLDGSAMILPWWDGLPGKPILVNTVSPPIGSFRSRGSVEPLATSRLARKEPCWDTPIFTRTPPSFPTALVSLPVSVPTRPWNWRKAC